MNKIDFTLIEKLVKENEQRKNILREKVINKLLWILIGLFCLVFMLW